MKNYLLIDSRGEYEAVDSRDFFELAAELKRCGDTVEILLVQNGVLPARAGAKADALTAAVRAGIPIFAESFAIKERAIGPLPKCATEAPLSIVIDRMAQGWNVIWH